MISKSHTIPSAMKQMDFFNHKTKMEFGGSLMKGKRKTKRPLSTKHSIHLVMHADSSVLKKNEYVVGKCWRRMASRFGVRTYEFSVNSNHLHAVIRIHSRALYARFIQAVSGGLALRLKLKWTARPFTRLVTWGRAFQRVKKYVYMNWVESMGFVDLQPRGRGSTKRRVSFL